MPDVTLKAHDTWPPLNATLSTDTGPLDLSTAATVKLLLKADSTLVSGVCTIVSASDGTVRYDWQTGDTATPGTYQCEFEITWATGKIETVPNDGYAAISIEEDLG